MSHPGWCSAEDLVGGGASELVVDPLMAPSNGKREANYATNRRPENCECQEDTLLQLRTGNGLRGRRVIVAGASCSGPGKIER